MDAADPNILSRGKQLWHESQDHEAVLHFLRDQGVSKLESIKAVRSICQVSLGEAKRIVTLSPQWSGSNESTSALHDEIDSALGLTDRS